MKNRTQHVIAFLLLLFSLNASAQIPIFNSFPSARATVFLDFDGQYVDGTAWNYNGSFTCGPSGLTTSQITEIFNRVSEDYRPFNVNITTDSTVYWSAPVYQRQRIVLTVTSSWYGTPVGGISYIGSFTWGDNTPSFVFTQLLNFNTKYIAEATAHEIGHTLGLKHQSAYDANCNKTNEYNYGSGSGEIGWAPVMGCGYYQNFTLWHNGADPYGCNQYQDDLGIITLSNGFGYRPDDYSSNVDNTATQAAFVNNQFTMNGVIEQINDKDVFRFTVPSAGRFHLDATPFSVAAGDVGSNLDIQLELIDNTATVIGTYNPATLLSASIDTALNPGNYYVRVFSTGNVYAPDYASLGSYTLSSTFTPNTILPLHQLSLRGTTDNNKHNLDWIIVADEVLTQQVLEVSSDGRNFQTLSSLNTNERSYSYSPNNKSDVLYYRLKTNFNNGTEYYSNVISLKNILQKTKPSLVSNMVNNSISINSPGIFNYVIYDLNGRTIARGNLSQGTNTVSIDHLTASMYLIQFNNGQEQYTEKFMKQ